MTAATDAFDYVIVGSGAAGATAARVLVDTGRSVALVEEGPRVERDEYSDRLFPTLRTLYRNQGLQQTRGPGPSLVMQGRCVGGSTVVNSAIVRRLPEAVWAEWRDEYGLGDALPYRELEACADRLESELNAAPTPREVWGGNSALMDRGRRALGISGGAMTRFVLDCQASARCQLGCPFDAKQSMLVTFIPYAEARGAVVLSDLRVDRVLWRGDRAVGVAAGSRRILARRGVIIAASVTQTPLLLQRSGIRSRHLGRHFQAHPGVALVGLFDEPVRVWSGATQGYEIDEYRERYRAKLETAALPPELLFAALPGVGRRWVRAMADSEHVTSWAVALRAYAEGRVRRTLTGTTIEFTVTPRDMANLRTALRRLAELSFAAGAREVLPGIPGLPERIGPDQVALFDRAPDDPSAYSFVISHLFGTARMSRRPSDGVVGPDFAVHGRRNLFVVDSSVFPTNLGVNPQLTVMSIAMLAAERIAA